MDTPQLSIHDRVEAAFLLSPHLRRRPMQVSTQGNSVRISGRVNSYFEKQMAQEVARQIDGVQEIENDLKVDWND